MSKKKKSNPLRVARIVLATLFFLAITLLMLGVSDVLPHYLGWTARLQFMPAVLALNVGAFIVVLLLTVLLGRVYCSVICPLGVLQDSISWLGRKQKKNRYSYSPAKNWLRYGVLLLFIIALVAGASALASLIEPYSAYGRMVSTVSHPKSWIPAVVAVVTLAVIAVLAWRNGRTWCNTLCPVGSILGLLSRFSVLKPVIDESKCNGCSKCSKNCRAACINYKAHTIDYSRCVDCMDCIGQCNQHAISYKFALVGKNKPAPVKSKPAPVKSKPAPVKSNPAPAEKKSVQAENNAAPVDNKPSSAEAPANDAGVDASRRAFVVGAALAVGAGIVKAQEMKVDGGLAEIIDKEVPKRQTRITPPGSGSARNMYQHCTACQLCVSNCPNHVLRPSTDLAHFMQPESSFEKGYCRPECTICSEVCPAGAIKPISVEEKASTQVGHAVWIRENCVVLTDEVTCGNCERHCPTGAIQMVRLDGTKPERRRNENRRWGDSGNNNERLIPVIDEERCIGCGACENLCPARSFSAIYVEGHQVHKTI